MKAVGFVGRNSGFGGIYFFVSLFSARRLWKSCEKRCAKVCGKFVDLFCTGAHDSEFFTVLWISLHNLRISVESFAEGFSQPNNRGKIRVLHIFHRAYYNYY